MDVSVNYVVPAVCAFFSCAVFMKVCLTVYDHSRRVKGMQTLLQGGQPTFIHRPSFSRKFIPTAISHRSLTGAHLTNIQPAYLSLSSRTSTNRGERAIRPQAGSEPGEIRIEFVIRPDGRVEETVFGAKGEECLEITEDINEKLGEVVFTEPTAEMSEQPVDLMQEEQNVAYENKHSNW